MQNNSSDNYALSRGYESPSVTRESLDSGGNYSGATWPGMKNSGSEKSSGGIGNLGTTIIP